MKITVGVWKGQKPAHNNNWCMPKEDLILSYETKRFSGKGFIKRLINFNQMIKNKFENIKDEEIVLVGMDLLYKGETKLGGCQISGATINACRISIVEMAVTQLVRQLKNTLKELRKNG